MEGGNFPVKRSGAISSFFVLSFLFSFPLSPSFPIESLSHGVAGRGGPGQGKGGGGEKFVFPE